jgi:hypothetical protein
VYCNATEIDGRLPVFHLSTCLQAPNGNPGETVLGQSCVSSRALLTKLKAVQDTAGKVTGNEKLQAEGKMDKAKGAAGDAKDAVRDATGK